MGVKLRTTPVGVVGGTGFEVVVVDGGIVGVVVEVVGIVVVGTVVVVVGAGVVVVVVVVLRVVVGAWVVVEVVVAAVVQGAAVVVVVVVVGFSVDLSSVSVFFFVQYDGFSLGIEVTSSMSENFSLENRSSSFQPCFRYSSPWLIVFTGV